MKLLAKTDHHFQKAKVQAKIALLEEQDRLLASDIRLFEAAPTPDGYTAESRYRFFIQYHSDFIRGELTTAKADLQVLTDKEDKDTKGGDPDLKDIPLVLRPRLKQAETSIKDSAQKWWQAKVVKHITDDKSLAATRTALEKSEADFEALANPQKLPALKALHSGLDHPPIDSIYERMSRTLAIGPLEELKASASHTSPTTHPTLVLREQLIHAFNTDRQKLQELNDKIENFSGGTFLAKALFIQSHKADYEKTKKAMDKSLMKLIALEEDGQKDTQAIILRADANYQDYIKRLRLYASTCLPFEVSLKAPKYDPRDTVRLNTKVNCSVTSTFLEFYAELKERGRVPAALAKLFEEPNPLINTKTGRINFRDAGGNVIEDFELSLQELAQLVQEFKNGGTWATENGKEVFKPGKEPLQSRAHIRIEQAFMDSSTHYVKTGSLADHCAWLQFIVKRAPEVAQGKTASVGGTFSAGSLPTPPGSGGLPLVTPPPLGLPPGPHGTPLVSPGGVSGGARDPVDPTDPVSPARHGFGLGSSGT